MQSDYSGAAIVNASGKLVIEGKKGAGESFMRGIAPAEILPPKVIDAVKGLYVAADRILSRALHRAYRQH